MNKDWNAPECDSEGLKERKNSLAPGGFKAGRSQVFEYAIQR
jgi:hypothetical protein